MPQHWSYRDYTADIDNKTALRILVAFGVCLVAAEVALRIAPPRYPRPNGNSMYGVRTIMQLADRDPRPKVIFTGDSTVLGGGVADGTKIFPALAASALQPAVSVYDLGVTGGSAKTNCVVLQAATKLNVPNIRQFVIEVSPVKLMTDDPAKTASPTFSAGPVTELLRFLPDGRFSAPWLEIPSTSFADKTEYKTEFEAGSVSAILQNRDYVKNAISGGFPAFWVSNFILPASLKDKMFSKGADGNNRLSANPEDGIYAGPKEATDKQWSFIPQGEFDALSYSIDQATKCSERKPIVLIGPMHYEYNAISDRERASVLEALSQLKTAVTNLCAQKGAQLVWVDSTKVQVNDLWTRSFAHYRPPMHQLIWNMLKPKLTAP